MKKRNIVIFAVISIIALQTLFFVHTYGANVLVHDDLFFAPIAQTIKHGTNFWDIKDFSLYRDQRPIFPNLLLVANIVLTSWNVKYQLYFGWILLTVSLVPMYMMLKESDSKLHWFMILIAAFTFNTAQYVSLLMDIASRQMVLTATATIFTIYFINRVRTHRLALLPAIASAVIASFSGIAGLSLWIVGILSFSNFDKSRRIPLILWVSSAVVTFVAYFANYSYGIEDSTLLNPHDIFTWGPIKLFLLNLSNGLVPAISRLVPEQVVGGFTILLLITGGSIYLKKRQREFKALLPWVQFGLVGIAYAIMATVARPGELAPLSHYITLDKFAQISAIIIATLIFLQIHRNSNKNSSKTIASVIFSIFILIVILSLGSSYVLGWYDGSVYHKEKISYLECMTNPIFNFKCTLIDSESDILHTGGTIIKELHLGPFSSKAESMLYLHEPLLQEVNWKNVRGDLNGLGTIEYIDAIPTNSDKQIQVNRTQTFIDIVGWGVISKSDTNIDSVSKIRERLGIEEKNPRVDSAYVFIDGKVHTQIHYGQLRQDIVNTNNQVTTQESGWNGIIDLRQLSDGCHNVSVRLVAKGHYYEISSESQICINPR